MSELLQRPSLGEWNDASPREADNAQGTGTASSLPVISDDRPPPITAIRRNCVYCCMGNSHGVALCVSKACVAYLLRHGRKPTAEELATAVDDEQRKLSTGPGMKVIKAFCVSCAGSLRAVRACKTTDCPLHEFRGWRTRRSRRVLTDEQRAALKARLAKGRAAKAARQSP